MSRTHSLLRLAAPLALVAFLGLQQTALAVNVPAGGGAVPLPGSTAAVNLDLAGPIIEDVKRPFSVGGVKGYLQDRVVRSNNTGLLYFYYRVVLEATSIGRITVVRKAGFGPAAHTIDSDWRIDGLGIRQPSAAQRSADGNWVSFNHVTTSIGPGESSRFVYIGAGTKLYKLSGQTLLVYKTKSGGGTIPLKSFAPVH
jgi:hypothetical protein